MEDIQTGAGLIWRIEHLLCSGLNRKQFFTITGNFRIAGFQNCNKTVWWVHPSQQPNTHAAACSLPSPMGWGENRREVRRLMDEDNGSLISLIEKAIAAHTSEEIRGILSLLRTSRQVFSCSLKGKESASITIA